MALKVSLIFCTLLVLSYSSSRIPSAMAARVICRNLPLPFIQISKNDEPTRPNANVKAALGALELELIPGIGAVAGGGRRRLSQLPPSYTSSPYIDPPYVSSPELGSPPGPPGK